MILPLVLLLVSLITHFIFFGHPGSIVFDEVYFGKFAGSYSTGQYYFDVHPPLSKLILKFFLDFLGSPANVDFSAIGNTLPWQLVVLRIIPILAGVLLPIIVYYICRNLNFSKISAFTAGILVCLENSLIVQSRFILIDSFLLLFGFASVLLYLLYVRRGKYYLLLLSALLAACAFSIKWTGLSFLLLILISEIARIKNLKKILKFISIYAVIGIVFYLSIFAIHFAYLNHSGPGDDFMSDRFQRTLIGNQYEHESSIQPKKFFGKFIELNIKMMEANQSLTTHQYGSLWYTWPIMLRPIFYWQSGDEYIYYLGNPVIYWLGTLSIIALAIILAWYLFKKKISEKVQWFIFVGYLVNFLPFIFIGRVMFIYHYEAALVFSIISLVFLIDRIKNKRIPILLVLIALSLISFIFFSPLTYGLHLSEQGLMHRMWLSSWR